MLLHIHIDDEMPKVLDCSEDEIPEWVVSEAEGSEIQIAEIIQNHIDSKGWFKGTNMTITVIKDATSN